MRKFCILIVALLKLVLVNAQPGTLDYSFGTNGIVKTSIGEMGDYAHTMAIQSDGKIVVAGKSENWENSNFIVVRYNPDGSTDNTFGLNGIVTTSIDSYYCEANSVAIQPDGKIVISGTPYNASFEKEIAIIRYNVDGNIDSTFGTNGMATTPLSSDLSSRMQTMALQPDGKIVVGGCSYNGSDNDFALARYNTDGTIDSAFGINGMAISTIGSGFDIINSMEVLADGKIIVAGSSYNGSISDFAVARYNDDGSLDNTFGINGIVITSITNSQDDAVKIAVQTNGKYVVAGESDNGINRTDFDFVVVRYNTDGALDNSFGANGIATFPVGSGDDRAKTLAIQSDGKILITGQYISDAYHIAVIRCTTDGTLDATFGLNGKVFTAIGSNDWANTMAIQSDGKIVVAGNAKESQYNIIVARYNNDELFRSLTVSTNTLAIASEANNNITFDITSNIGWTVSSDQTWLTVSETSGSGNKTITLNAQANPATTVRIATLTVSGTGAVAQTITVIQDAGTTGISEIGNSEIYIFPNPANKTLFVKGLTQNSTIAVFDMGGKVLINKLTTNNQFDISKLSNGIYTIQIIDKTGVKTCKFLKK